MALPDFIDRTDLTLAPSGSYSAPALADLDSDGDVDLVSGEHAGRFRFFENTGTPAAPTFVERTGSQNPLSAFDVGFDSAPALGDLDGDGDIDLIAGERRGDTIFFENTGTPTSPGFVERTGTASPLDGVSVFRRSQPALIDLDADGDPDLGSGLIMPYA